MKKFIITRATEFEGRVGFEQLCFKTVKTTKFMDEIKESKEFQDFINNPGDRESDSIHIYASNGTAYIFIIKLDIVNALNEVYQNGEWDEDNWDDGNKLNRDYDFFNSLANFSLQELKSSLDAIDPKYKEAIEQDIEVWEDREEEERGGE